MIYAYSIVTVDYFRFQFGSDYPATMCSTVYSCLMYSLNLGLRNGGGIADSMDLMEITDDKFNSKLLFDISYFMLINIVSLNIIFGIIIDTFAELRDAQNTRDEDLLNTCFVCGHSRDVFEKEGISFDKHIKFQHNPNQYVYFLIYLRTKPKDEFDGTEEYVYTQYMKKKTNWVPIGNTKFINVDEDDDCEAKIDNLGANMSNQIKETDGIKESVEGLKGQLGDLQKTLLGLQKDNRVIKKRTKNWGVDADTVTGLYGGGIIGISSKDALDITAPSQPVKVVPPQSGRVTDKPVDKRKFDVTPTKKGLYAPKSGKK